MVSKVLKPPEPHQGKSHLDSNKGCFGLAREGEKARDLVGLYLVFPVDSEAQREEAMVKAVSLLTD